MNQRGFATLEVILMVMVIGVLASIAVPRFTAVTAAANTAKIQADLTTIDTAIAVYHMEYGEDKNPSIDDLVTNKYLQAKPEPPNGKCYYETTSTDGTTSTTTSTEPKAVPDTKYDINNDGQAILGTGNTADKFKVPKKTATP